MAHIGIDARLLAYRLGGISTYTRNLIDALERLDHRNEYTLFKHRKTAAPLAHRFAEVPVWTPPHHRLEKRALSFELSWWSRRYKTALDIFHSPDFIPPNKGAARFIITVHDLAFLHQPEHKDRASSRYYNDQIEWAVKKADHILSVSHATKADLINLLEVPEHKITVQPNGVDAVFFPRRMDQAQQHKIGIEPGYILFVGTIEPRKNLETLLTAYTLIRDPPPLVVIGKRGWLYEETLAQMETLRNAGHPIIHHENVEDDETLATWYSGASVFVLPSYYEGFGLPVLEAMACGTPVIASNRASLPEIIGDAGDLLPANEPDAWAHAIDRALRDYHWREQMTMRGYRRVELFTWENSARIAQSVYEQIARLA